MFVSRGGGHVLIYAPLLLLSQAQHLGRILNATRERYVRLASGVEDVGKMWWLAQAAQESALLCVTAESPKETPHVACEGGFDFLL